MARRLPFLLASLLTLAPLPSFAGGGPPSPTVLPDTLSLEDALRLFQQRGLDLLIAEAAVESAEGDQRIAGAIPNPNWAAGVYRSFFNSGLFETQYGWFVGVGDSNALEDTLSGKRGLRLRVARAALAAARLSRVDAERSLGFQVKQAYIQAVLARDALDFALEVQKAALETLQLNQKKYSTGAISEVDVAKVETAKLEADQAVDSATAALRGSKVALAFLLGVRGLVPDFHVAQDLPKFAIPPAIASATPESLLRDALEHRADLRALDRQRERAGASLALAKRLRFPDISLNLQYQQQGTAGGAPGAPSPTVDSNNMPLANGVYVPAATVTPIQPPMLTVNLAGTLPLLYQQQGEIRRAEADVRTQDLQRAKIEAQLVTDVETAWNAYSNSRRLVERAEARLLDRVKFVLDKVEFQYTKGQASLLEFLDARRQYIQINVEYLQDLANYWTAVYQLEQAVGMELR